MNRPFAHLLAVAILSMAPGSAAAAQISLQSTPPPTVTAENEAWYLERQPDPLRRQRLLPGRRRHSLRSQRDGQHRHVWQRSDLRAHDAGARQRHLRAAGWRRDADRTSAGAPAIWQGPSAARRRRWSYTAGRGSPDRLRTCKRRPLPPERCCRCPARVPPHRRPRRSSAVPPPARGEARAVGTTGTVLVANRARRGPECRPCSGRSG